MRDLSNRNDVVVDPFLGSESTLIAAEKTSRRCRGVELDPRYVDVILHRFEALTKSAARLQSTGETFAQLATRRARETESPSRESSPNKFIRSLRRPQIHSRSEP